MLAAAWMLVGTLAPDVRAAAVRSVDPDPAPEARAEGPRPAPEAYGTSAGSDAGPTAPSTSGSAGSGSGAVGTGGSATNGTGTNERSAASSTDGERKAADREVAESTARRRALGDPTTEAPARLSDAALRALHGTEVTPPARTPAPVRARESEATWTDPMIGAAAALAALALLSTTLLVLARRLGREVQT